ncbi:MAG: DUF523 domain-containing protein [Planctomycetota bacterium]
MPLDKVLVSACLLGRACRFDGKDKRTPALVDALAGSGAIAVPFCPEEAGGLSTPRAPCLLDGGDGEDVLEGRARVLTEGGDDVTESFLSGARQATAKALDEGCRVAYLKERSPSCGCAQIHAKGGVRPGCGVTTALLRRAGISTISVD